MIWRFRRSIRAIQRMSEYWGAPQSVPQGIDVSEDTLSFSMPLYSQGTLENIEFRGWTLDTKIAVFIEVCRAVEFAHQLQIIHRDIKPANILLDDTLSPVLVDFDIAEIRFVTQVSVDEGGLGTPVFAAPEQLERAASADERSDIYSLGRLLYYMLLEHSPGVLIEEEPELSNLREVHPALVAAIRKATQHDPRRRHKSASELIGEVEQYHTGRARVRASVQNLWRWTRNHLRMFLALSLISLTMTTSLVFHRQARGRASHLSVELLAELEALDIARLDIGDSIATLLAMEASLEALESQQFPLEHRRLINSSVQESRRVREKLSTFCVRAKIQHSQAMRRLGELQHVLAGDLPSHPSLGSWSRALSDAVYSSSDMELPEGAGLHVADRLAAAP